VENIKCITILPEEAKGLLESIFPIPLSAGVERANISKPPKNSAIMEKPIARTKWSSASKLPLHNV
jgi:hypothetical protein